MHVEQLSDGDWLVRGTGDPQAALALIVDLWDWSDDQRSVDVTANWCHTMLKYAQPGYYRKINCLPGSRGHAQGWKWELGFADSPGWGAFEGVYFNV